MQQSLDLAIFISSHAVKLRLAHLKQSQQLVYNVLVDS